MCNKCTKPMKKKNYCPDCYIEEEIKKQLKELKNEIMGCFK